MKAVSLLAAAVLAACAAEQNRRPIDSGADKAVAVPSPSPRSAEARAESEEVLEHGGELDLTQLPAATVERANGEIVAWGLTEVPGDSRLQAALALADANARAELVAAIRVGLASSTTVSSDEAHSGEAASGASRTTESQEVNVRTAQVANGILPALAPPTHGWKKVRRKGEVVLLVCSRLAAREDALVSVLTQALKQSQAAANKDVDPALQAQKALEQLGKGHKLGAE